MLDEQELRLKYAGAIGLICELALHVRDMGDERDELLDQAEQAVKDWCALTGWTYQRILHRIEVFPPANPNLRAPKGAA